MTINILNLKITEISLTVLGLIGSSPRCWTAVLSLGALRGRYILCLFQLPVAVNMPWLNGLWPPPSSLCLCLYIVSFSSDFFLSASLIRRLVIGFKVHLDNPKWSHLRVHNLITFVKTLLVNEVTFIGSKHLTWIFGGEGHFSAYQFGLNLSENFLELDCEVGEGPLQVVGISSREWRTLTFIEHLVVPSTMLSASLSGLILTKTLWNICAFSSLLILYL